MNYIKIFLILLLTGCLQEPTPDSSRGDHRRRTPPHHLNKTNTGNPLSQTEHSATIESPNTPQPESDSELPYIERFRALSDQLVNKNIARLANCHKQKVSMTVVVRWSVSNNGYISPLSLEPANMNEDVKQCILNIFQSIEIGKIWKDFTSSSTVIFNVFHEETDA